MKLTLKHGHPRMCLVLTRTAIDNIRALRVSVLSMVQQSRLSLAMQLISYINFSITT